MSAQDRRVTPQEVADVIGMAQPDPESADGVWLAAACDAVTTLVPDTVPRVRAAESDTPWPADVWGAALMQAQRLFARRSSPTGVAAYTDAGPSYVARWDPDVERLLRIGSWAPPQVG